MAGWGAALAVLVAAVGAWWVGGGAFGGRGARRAAWRAGLGLEAAERARGFDGRLCGCELAAAGPGRVRCVFPGGALDHLRNFQGTLHGGAAAAIVDVVTTLALFAGGHAPGVSADLKVSYALPVKAGSAFEVEARVLRVGRSLAVIEARVWASGPGGEVCSTPSAVATHTKVLPRTQQWLFALAWMLPPRMVEGLLRRYVWKDRSPGATQLAKTVSGGFVSLPSSWDSKDEYWRAFAEQVGTAGFKPIGFDAELHGLCACACEPAPDGEESLSCFRLPVAPELCNAFGMLHGGAIFTAVDCAATACLAASGALAGPTVNCSVHFLSPAPRGSEVYISTHVQKLGKTLHFVSVSLYKARRGRSARWKLVARGDVIKAAAAA